MARSSATNKNSLYDSYIRAFRWATDRLGDQGVVAFVSNNGWVDGNTADGIRKTFADEFSDVYVYNLRGNQSTAGETSRREGGKVFGSGARTGVAVLVAAKRRGSGPCILRYHGVADYLSREEKLAGLDDANLSSVPWHQLSPNADGDWLSQRNDTFGTFPAIGSKDAAELGHFALHSGGLKTNRDAWCYNFSRRDVAATMRGMIETYNRQALSCRGSEAALDREPTAISWSRGLVADALRARTHSFKPDRVYRSLYRPFAGHWAYFDRPLNDMVYRLESIFPTPHHENSGIYIVGLGATKDFCLLMSAHLPDLT